MPDPAAAAAPRSDLPWPVALPSPARTRALLLALLVVVALAAGSLMVAGHRQVPPDATEALSQLARLKQIDTDWEVGLLRERAGLVNEEARGPDPAGATAALLAEVAADPALHPRADAELARRMTALQDSIAQKARLAERFSSANAGLRQALAALPRAADAASDELRHHATHDPGHEASRAQIGSILFDVAQQARGDDGDRADDIDRRLLRLAANPLVRRGHPAGDDALTAFVANARGVLAGSPEVDALFAGIAELRTGDRIDAVVSRLQTTRQEAAGQLERSRLRLMALALVLLALFVLTALRLVSSHVTLRRVNRDLGAANDRLEDRVRERTRDLERTTQELADANLIVRNSSTVLYRVRAEPGFPLVYVSNNVDVLGFDAATLLADPSWATRVTHPDDLARVASAFMSLFAPGAADGSIEYRLVEPGGDTRWVETRYHPVLDASGELVEIEGLVFDVSARKRVDAERDRQLEHEARYRQILDALSEPVFLKDARGQLMWGNRAFREFFALSAEELLRRGAPVDEAPESTHAFARDDAVVFATGRPLDIPVETVRRHDGATRRWHTVKSPIFDIAGTVVATVGVSRDITERLDDEAALRDSKALLDRTGRIGGVGGWQYDLESREIRITDETYRIQGLAVGARVMNDDALDRYPPGARERAREAMQRCLHEGVPFDLELPMDTADGRRIWVRVNGHREAVDGVPRRVVGALQDITARRALQDELRHTGERLQLILESLPCGVSVYDARQRIVVTNSRYRELLDLPQALLDQPGVTLQDVLRHNAARGDYGPDGAALLQAYHDAARRRPDGWHDVRVRPNGVAIEIRGGALPDGGFVLTHTDVTARFHAEAAFERSARLLRNAIDAVDDAFAVFDENERLVVFNEPYRRLDPTRAGLVAEGVTFESLIRASAEHGVFSHQIDDVEAWVKEKMASFRAGSFSATQQLSDGRTLRIMRRRTSDGHTVAMGTDISALVHATATAEAALLAKSRFIANISHELRTPMNAVLGMLKLLGATAPSPRQAGYLAKADTAARLLLRLLSDVLDFSKAEAGKMVLDPQPFAFETLLDELAIVLTANAGHKPVEVLFDVDRAVPPRLVGDAMRLLQVLANLGGNAVKFTPAGTVVVEVRVTGRDAGGVRLAFAVRDSGIGIAPEHQARIFNGFEQAEASTTRRYGGTGLGVAISQRLLGLMGGALALESQPGTGTVFSFELRLPVAAVPADAPLAATAGGEPVLLLETHDLARRIAAGVLQGAGCEVVLPAAGSTTDVDAVLGAWRGPRRNGRPPTAVLLDTRWPQLPQLIDALRRAAPEVRLVLLAPTRAAELSASALPHDAMLVKPLLPSSLRGALASTASGADTAPAPMVHEQRLAGLRLLVVEDNADNQQVARELLEDEGAVVTVAGNGRVAVDHLERAGPAWDAVLMDLQMPVMDGFEATRQLRRRWPGTTLPVVAMTANDAPEDREACLAAGMNDHVAKPFDLDLLVRTLLRHVARRTAVPARPLAAGGTTLGRDDAEVRRLARAGAVALDTALDRLGGRVGTYARTLASFVDGLPATRAALADETTGDDAHRARLHALKGVAGTLGLASLAGAAAQAEQALRAREPDVAAARGALDAVLHAIDGGLPPLRELARALHPVPRVAASTDAGPAGAERDALRAHLERIAARLREADMAATADTERLVERFGAALGERLAPLDDAVGRLDFEAALRACDALLAEAST